MDIDRFKQLEELFDTAVALAPEQRHAYLEQACGDDTDLLAMVDRMLGRVGDDTAALRAEVTAASVTLDMPTPGEAVPTLGPGDRVGRYVIREAIGEGGFAIVYAADQTEPVQRRVALKIIKVGMDTRQVIARFEAERQALAMMDHANVAKVFDAGCTDTGRPYFVMEYVAGDPITDYCDRHRLTTPLRLELFIQACKATQHAHQKGIIHRDIKPSNVLVTVREGAPQVKMIDFGIAKAIGGELTEQTVYTEHGLLLGTPEYMSPEQAEMRTLDIDTRTDIYSLGVLLYELLVGDPPFDSGYLRQAGSAEIQRIIREEEPPKPSTRLSTLGDTSVIAGKRNADARSLLRDLRGDLDWITMKAVDKDRVRRYETASSLAEDVRRHLNDEPVLAGPPSAVYRAGKFIRRHRVGVLASAVVALAVVGGAAATTWQAVRASRAEVRAVEQRDRADRRYQEARDLADFFMEDVHDAIVELPGTMSTREMVVQRALTYLNRLQQESADDISVKLDIARGRRRVGQILGGTRGPSRRRVDEALQQFEVSLSIHEEILATDPGHVDNRKGLVASHLNVGDMVSRGPRKVEADDHYERALAVSEALLAERPDDVYAGRLAYASALKIGDRARGKEDFDRAAQLYDRCREIVERLAETNPNKTQAQRDVTLVYTRVARINEQQDNLDAALQYYELVLTQRQAIAEREPQSARARRDVKNGHKYVASVSSKMGGYDKALEHYKQAVAIAGDLRAADPEDQRARDDLADVQRRYGNVLEEVGRRPEAREQIRSALEEYEVLAAEHPGDPKYLRLVEQLRTSLDRLESSGDERGPD